MSTPYDVYFDLMAVVVVVLRDTERNKEIAFLEAQIYEYVEILGVSLFKCAHLLIGRAIALCSGAFCRASHFTAFSIDWQMFTSESGQCGFILLCLFVLTLFLQIFLIHAMLANKS